MKKSLLKFYVNLRRIIKNIGIFTLEQCPYDILPKQGVYIFFDQDEPHDIKLLPYGRIVRIGTHGVSRNSKSALWDRLKAHRGYDNGGGNHRGSIFRKHIGVAICRQKSYHSEIRKQWMTGSSKPKGALHDEANLEKDVSKYIRRLPFTVIDIPGASFATNKRAVFERDSILLLSWAAQNELISIGTQWLGREAGVAAITDSGLWNVKHVWRSDKPQEFQPPAF